jgi:hypothetical protein
LTNKPEALSDVRRADARSANILCREGVSRCFHVSRYKVEPAEAVAARNLLAKDCCRAALADEVVPVRPEVPLVSSPRSAACRAERLARAGSRPNGTVVWPSRKPQGKAPSADTGEEVALCVSSQLIWPDVSYVPLIYVSIRNVTLPDQLPQPCRGVPVNLVVVSTHQ